MAAKKLGMKTVPCIRLDHLTDEQRRAYALAHNKTAENSEWDYDMLSLELGDIFDIDMEQFGFDLGDDGEDDVEAVEDDFDEEDIPEEPKSKYGDIYQLGNHRVMCGDSTKLEDVEKLMNGETVDLFLTDPPYNVNYQGGTKDAMKIMNDSMEDSAFRAFLTDAFKCANAVMKDGAAFYIWHADSEGLNFRAAVRNTGWRLRECLVWVKNALVLGRLDYHYKHEPALYGWKDGTHYFTSDRTQTTVYDDKIDFKKLKKEELVKLLEEIYSDKNPTTVIYEDKPLINDIHPTMKPIRLMARLVKNSTKPGGIVLDLFGGSGSTMMACEQLNRTAYSMELDPRYVDAMINRWENFTGEEAVLITENTEE